MRPCSRALLAHTSLTLQLEEKENAQGSSAPARVTDQNAKPLEEPAENQKETPAEAQKESTGLAPSWEAQCQRCLGASKAIAVLKASGSEEAVTAIS